MAAPEPAAGSGPAGRPGGVVRALGPEDRAAWGELWRAYVEFYRAAVPAEVTEWLWARLAAARGAPEDLGQIFGRGAFDERGRLVGLAHYHYQFCTWSRRPRCYLEDLFVDPSARSRGHGRRLIEATYTRADTLGGGAGCDDVFWLTSESNSRARALYDKVGKVTDHIKYGRKGSAAGEASSPPPL